MAGESDKGPGETEGMVIVGKDVSGEGGSDGGPGIGLRGKIKLERVALEVEGEVDRAGIGKGDILVEDLPAFSRVRHEDIEGPLPRVIEADPEIVVVGGIVIGHESGHVLERFRVEIDAGFRADGKILNAASHHALLEEAGDWFRAEKAQPAGTCLEAEPGFREWAAQGLKMDIEALRGEMDFSRPVFCRRSGETGGSGSVFRGDAPAMIEDEPAILPPAATLDGRFPSENAVFAIDRSPTEMSEVPLPVGRFDEGGMTGFLESGLGGSLGREQGIIRMNLIRTLDVPGAGEGGSMVIFGAALSGQQVVVALALVKMGTFDKADLGAFKNIFDWSHKSLLFSVIFL